MGTLVGCELCERPDVEAAGTTHFGGYRFEVCADCRGIVSQARSQIAQLGIRQRPTRQQFFMLGAKDLQEAGLTLQSHGKWTGRSAEEWNNHGSVLLPAWCPGCGRKGSIGAGSCEGKPGCSYCLRPLDPGEIK